MFHDLVKLKFDLYVFKSVKVTIGINIIIHIIPNLKKISSNYLFILFFHKLGWFANAQSRVR